MSKVIVIGSGLSSIVSIKVLISKGIKPIILDCGKTLKNSTQDLKNKISKLNKKDWNKDEIDELTENNTLNNTFPKKLYMGSDFFYFRKNNFLELIMKNRDNNFLPAASHAKNGLSTSWGSAVLPLSNLEQENFPFNLNDLKKYYNISINDVDYVASEDNLNKQFDLIKKPNHLHEVDKDIDLILKKFENNKNFNKNFISGKSRLLANFSKSNGCLKCGQCMSGCFYDHIYKPEKEFNSFIKSNKIEYLPDVFVDSFEEKKNKIIIKYYDKENKEKTINCDKLILAAGALNSTIIHAKSYNLFDYRFKLLSKSGTVTPLLNFNFQKDIWPNRHTLPLIFLTLLDKNNIDLYSQISKPNELVIKKLMGSSVKHSILSKIISKTFLIAHSNLSSKNSDFYEFALKKSGNNPTKVEIEKIINSNKINKEKEIRKKVNNIFYSANIFPINFARKYTDSQHNGGSLPMVKDAKQPNETFENGTTKFSNKIFYVDSSVLPNLPATPIALPMMANAARIIDKINFS